jgi:putative transcriptional regulator
MSCHVKGYGQPLVHNAHFFKLRLKIETIDQSYSKQNKKGVKNVDWFGLGKKRSRLGKWLDRSGVSQQELQKRSGVSKGTISRLCSDDEYMPTLKTAKKVITSLKKLGADVNYDDFWSV